MIQTQSRHGYLAERHCFSGCTRAGMEGGAPADGFVWKFYPYEPSLDHPAAANDTVYARIFRSFCSGRRLVTVLEGAAALLLSSVVPAQSSATIDPRPYTRIYARLASHAASPFNHMRRRRVHRERVGSGAAFDLEKPFF